MDPQVAVIALTAVVILIVFILSEQPVWVGLASSGALGLLLLEGANVAVSTVGAAPYSATAKYALVIVPMFLLMGVFAARAGIADDVFAIAERLTRRLPGGLGVATVLACGGFAAVTGSSVATVATVGRLAIAQMVDKGYKANAAAAIVAAGGTLGVLIPPSIVMVIFASLVGGSVGKLLIAGVIPGLITIIAYATTVVILYKRGAYRQDAKEMAIVMAVQNALEDRTAASSIATSEDGRRMSAPVAAHSRDELAAEDSGLTTMIGSAARFGLTRRNLVGTIYVIILFAIVIGGMYSGLFTATEAGAIAAGVALIFMIARNARNGWKGVARVMKDAAVEATSMVTMIFALLVGASIFSYFIIKTGIPNFITISIVAAELPVMVIVILALLIMVVLGFFLDAYSIMLITMPLLWPVLSALDVDVIWFGVLVVKAIEIGMLTPPFGINVFVVASASPLVTVEGVFKAVIPLVVAEFAVIALLLLVPDIVTWLPNLMIGS